MGKAADNNRLDAIAREAARLIETGRTCSIRDALRIAAESLGYSAAQLPGVGRVRKHAQAMAMQAMGEAAYIESKRRILGIAEELMSVLEQTFEDVEPVLMGRAAAGQVDAGVTLHIRLYTRRSLNDVAAMLVELGYNEPAFDTVQTRYGPVNRLRFTEDGIEIVVARCLPQFQLSRDQDMFTGKRIPHVSLHNLRLQLKEPPV